MTHSTTKLVELIERFMRAMVRNKEQLILEGSWNECVLIKEPVKLRFSCDGRDYPQLVGKAGQNIQAVERIIHRISEANKVMIEFELIRPPYQGRSQLLFRDEPNWPKADMDALWIDMLRTCDPNLGVSIRHLTVTSEYVVKRQHRTVIGYVVETQKISDVSEQFVNDLRQVFRLIGRTCGRWIEVKEE